MKGKLLHGKFLALLLALMMMTTGALPASVAASNGPVIDELAELGSVTVYNLQDLLDALEAAVPGDVITVGGVGFVANNQNLVISPGVTLIFGPNNEQSDMQLQGTKFDNHGTIIVQGYINFSANTKINNNDNGSFYYQEDLIKGPVNYVDLKKIGHEYKGLIQYYKNDGSAVSYAQTILNGSSLVILNIEEINDVSGISDLFENPGYDFLGWGTSKDDKSLDDQYQPGAIKNVNNNYMLILYAQWAPRDDISYYVHYYLENTTDILHDSKLVENQTMATTVSEIAVDITGYTPDAPSKELTLAATANEIVFNYAPRADIVVTFNATGGTSANPPSKEVTYKSNYGPLAITSWAGHNFLGWYTAETGGTLVTSSTLVTNASDHTLYAVWEVSTGGGGDNNGGGGNNNGGGGNIATPTPTPSPTPTPTPSATPSNGKSSTGTGSGSGIAPTPRSSSGGAYIDDDEFPYGGADIFISDHVAYIIGYHDGTVRPERPISRAEVATVFFRLLNDDMRSAFWTAGNAFNDVSPESWYNTAISVIANMGVIKGYSDNSYRPDAEITRAELAAIVARFARIMRINGDNEFNFTDIAGHWAVEEISRAAAIGWVSGYPDSTYRPDQSITRAEFITLTNNVLKRAPEDVSDLLSDEMAVWEDNADESAWYYLAVQEATNSHFYEYKDGQTVPGKQFEYEHWTVMKQNPDWLQLESQWMAEYSAP